VGVVGVARVAVLKLSQQLGFQEFFQPIWSKRCLIPAPNAKISL